MHLSNHFVDTEIAPRKIVKTNKKIITKKNVNMFLRKYQLF